MHDFSSLSAGAAYAMFRHGQDAQTDQLLAGGGGTATLVEDYPSTTEIRVVLDGDDNPATAREIQPVDLNTLDLPASWDDYIGQGPLKLQMQVLVNSAKARGARLPHIMFASGRPGVGKTTIARMMARQMGVQMTEMTPPFDNLWTFVNAALQLSDGDILFIDEIHLLTLKRRGDEFLLKVLEEGKAYMADGQVIELPDITILGATTEVGVLKQPVLDRFKKRPYFQAYSLGELGRIAISFARKHNALGEIDDMLALTIAQACRDTPRIIEEFILAARDLYYTLGRAPLPAELLSFQEVTPDGLTRQHVHYLTALRKYFARAQKDDSTIYVAGEVTMKNVLNETTQGINTVERFLIERGLIRRTGQGRALSDAGVLRAQGFLTQGLGPADHG